MRRTVLRMTWRSLHPSKLRAAWWAYAALRDLRRQLRENSDIRTVAVRNLPNRAAVERSRLRTGETAPCLERSLVVQRWLAAHGVQCEIVIGVGGSSSDFRAHAWLDCDPDGAGYGEILRLGVK